MSGIISIILVIRMISFEISFLTYCRIHFFLEGEKNRIEFADIFKTWIFRPG